MYKKETRRVEKGAGGGGGGCLHMYFNQQYIALYSQPFYQL